MRTDSKIHLKNRRKTYSTFNNSLGNLKKKKKEVIIDKAVNIQRREDNIELIYCSLALVMKIGLFTIMSSSLIKLSFASHQRIQKNFELSRVLKYESIKLEKLRLKFDEIFSIGGAQRIIEDQDQLISPNSVRVIWR